MAKKFYVVWQGHKTGVFDNWEECKKATNGYKGVKYLAFKSKEVAQQAFENGYESYWGKKTNKSDELSEEELLLIGEPVYPSMSVDAAWNTATLEMEYQAVDTLSGIKVFHQGPFEDATQNVGEFLAIVHALAHLKKLNNEMPVYSDSRTAIVWVKNKRHRSEVVQTNKNKRLFELLERAEKWLNENDYINPILKWETKAWGENPADFGRK